jgi:hypothetical protein
MNKDLQQSYIEKSQVFFTVEHYAEFLKSYQAVQARKNFNSKRIRSPEDREFS